MKPIRTVLSIVIAIGALACAGPSHSQPVSTDPQPQQAAAPSPAPTTQPAEPDPATVRRIEDLELQVSQLTLTIEQLRSAGVGTVQAQDVAYQPNQTRLASRNVQDALDELWSIVGRQIDAGTDMGQPGPGLFDLENGPLGPRNPTGDKQDNTQHQDMGPDKLHKSK